MYDVIVPTVLIVACLVLVFVVALDTASIRVEPARHRKSGRATVRKRRAVHATIRATEPVWIDVPSYPDGAVTRVPAPLGRADVPIITSPLRDFESLRELHQRLGTDLPTVLVTV